MAGYSYDLAGNMAQVTSSSGGRVDYTFDDASRLTQVLNRNAAGVQVSRTQFSYDGMSRLRTSTEADFVNGAWVTRSQKRRIYDGMNVVQERNGSNALLATYTRGSDMGGGIGGLLCRSFDTGKSFMHYDGRGNVVQLSDASGAVSGKYVYDAFGNTLSVSGGAAGLNPYRFSTKEHVGGLVYYGYRFYSPGMGKWINRDPIQENGGVNLYEFVDGNPLDRIDDYGLYAHIAGAAAIGFVAGFIGNVIGQIISQIAAGKLRCLKIDWFSALAAGASGAATAALASIGIGASVGAGGLIGGVGNGLEYVAAQWAAGERIDPMQLVMNVGIGAIIGAVGRGTYDPSAPGEYASSILKNNNDGYSFGTDVVSESVDTQAGFLSEALLCPR